MSLSNRSASSWPAAYQTTPSAQSGLMQKYAICLLPLLSAASTSGLLKHRGSHHGGLAFGSAVCTPLANDRLKIYKATAVH